MDPEAANYTPPLAAAAATPTVGISLQINGTAHAPSVDPRLSLLDLLRDRLQLTGTKKGCNQGACGACTVLLDGQRVLACLTLAVQCDGRQVTTIEGLATDEIGGALQAAFMDADGFQCGYCTPGQICSAVGMLDEVRRGLPSALSTGAPGTSIELSDDELKERMSGNLCRCGAYVGICDAIRRVHASGTGTVEP